MNLTDEELALLPSDVSEALALAGKPSKSAEELSKDAALASYEAGKDPQRGHEAMLAHAKAAAAHKAEALEAKDTAKKHEDKGDHESAAASRDASYRSSDRARHETDQIVVHAQSLGHGSFHRYAAEGEFITLRAWSKAKREKLKSGEIKGEFAGPHESFPIASAEDVSAAAASLGRAKGDTSTIKARIIAIAKKHGWEEGLPEAWKEVKNTADIFTASMEDLLESIVDEKGSGLTRWIPVLYPGTWNSTPFTAAMIKEMVETFNPKAESCPAKVGHEGDDSQPQLSQIREVKLAPCTLTNGKTVETCLWVRMERTPEALAAQRQYRKTSIEAWPPKHQSNPTPGKWNLKGLAFLGAAAPAVPGLPPTHLSVQNPQGGTQMDNEQITDPKDLKALKDQTSALAASLATANNETLRLKNEKEELETKLAAQKKALKADAIKAEISVFRDKLLPAQMQLAESVALALDSDEPTVTLSAGQAPVSPRTCLIALLQGFKSHGLTDPLDVPALSGKKVKTEEELANDEENLSAEEYSVKKAKEFKAKNPKATTKECLAEGRKALASRPKKEK